MQTESIDAAATPAALLDELRAARAEADAREVDVLRIAIEWAHAHPVLDGGEAWRIGAQTAVPLEELDGSALAVDPGQRDADEQVEWCGIPPVAWDAPAHFAAANRMSTAAGKALIRDALILCHRLPKTWARVLAGEVQAWRARRIAQGVLAAPADVVAFVDDALAPVAGTVGPAGLARALDEAMLLLHAEARELEQIEALDRRHVTLHHESINHTGVAEMTVRADWKDVHDLDQAVARVAAALKAAGSTESLDVRRSLAVGVLADPEQAQALLAGADQPAPSKRAVVYLHLSDLAVLGADPVATNATTGRAVLAQQVHQWLGRTDTHVVVKPVIDLAEHLGTDVYEVPDRLREQAGLVNPTCVFPWCSTPARRSDCDHIVPWDAGGLTSTDNLAPLCRHHHRLKTHAGWSYRRLEPRVFLWRDPHGHHYLRNRDGTSVVSRT